MDPELLFFRIHNNEGKMQVAPLPQITYRLLHPDSCFVLDAKTEVFLWIGKRSSSSDRTFSRAVASMLTKKPFKFAGQEHMRPLFCSVVAVLQSAEPLSFRSKFADWIATPLPPADVRKPFVSPYHFPLARLLDDPPEPDEVYDSPVTVDILDSHSATAVQFMELALSADSKTLQTQIVVLANPQQNMEAVEIIKPADHGAFHSGNCYLIIHTFVSQSVRNAKPKTIVYFWQGRETHATPVRSWPKWILSRTISDLRKRRGKRNVVPILVKEQCEPRHFMSLFPDNLLIIKRGSRSVLRRRALRKVVLYDLRQTGPSRVHAIEVPADSSSLHSRSTFLLQVPNMMMVWFGRASPDADQQLAEKLAAKLKHERTLKCFDEGEEPEEWFDVLDEHPYAKASPANDSFKHDAVLYNCTCANGWLEVYKVGPFHQGALNPSGVYLLDAHRDVFFWAGPDSSESVRRMARKWAGRFVDFLCEERSLDLFLEEVKPGEETKHFTQYAHAWNPSLSKPQWVDPAVLTRQRLEQLMYEDYLIQWKHSKEQRQALQLARIRHQSESGHALVFRKVDWSIELARINIYVPPPSTDDESYPSSSSSPASSASSQPFSSAEIPDGWAQFRLDTQKCDVAPLAVTLYGSWNNFSGNTMAKKGHTFVCALDIPVGRYTYRYELATMEELLYTVDDANPVLVRPVPSSASPPEKQADYQEDQVEASPAAAAECSADAPATAQFNSLHIRPSMRPLGLLELEALRKQEQEADASIVIKPLRELEEEAERRREAEETQALAAQQLKEEQDEIDLLVKSRRKAKGQEETEKQLRLEALRERRKTGEAYAASQLDPKLAAAGNKSAADVSLAELEARKASRRDRANTPVAAPPVEDVLDTVASRAALRRAQRESLSSVGPTSSSFPSSSADAPEEDSAASRRARRRAEEAGEPSVAPVTGSSGVSSSSSELEELEKRRQERNARRAARNL